MEASWMDKSKVTSSNNFHLLRHLAALQVLFGHTIFWLKLPFYRHDITQIIFCFPGVPIFFTISGFLISKTYLEHNKEKQRFFINRALRIYPGLWVCFIVVITMMAITNGISHKAMYNFSSIEYFVVQFLTASLDYAWYFTHALPYSHTGLYKTFPMHVTWTLTVELGFYLLIPVLFVFYGSTGYKSIIHRLWLISFFVLSFALCVAYKDSLPHHIAYMRPFAVIPFTYLWMFMLGSIAYLYFDKLKNLFVNKFHYWILIYLIFNYVSYKNFAFNYADYMRTSPLADVQVLLLSIVTISFAFSYSGLTKKLVRFSRVDFSYGIYLYHMPFVFTLYYLHIQHSVFLLPLVIVVATMLAAMSWFCIEKPAQRLKRKVLPAIIKARLA